MKRFLKTVWQIGPRLLYPLYEPGREKLDWDFWHLGANSVFANDEAPALPPAAERVRRNLLALSTLALVLAIGDVSVAGNEVVVYGVKLGNMSASWIGAIVSFILSYQVLHYCWLFHDSADAWRIKLSGLRTDSPELVGQQKHYRAVKPKFQTLYAWWHENSTTLDSWSELAFDLKNLEEQIQRSPAGDTETPSKRLDEYFERIEVLFGTGILGKSLANFDHYQRRLTKSQMLRWLLLDYYLPIGLGIASIVGLVSSVVAL